MTGMTPGRAAYEAYIADKDWTHTTWAALHPRVRADWDTVAETSSNADPRWPRCPDGCGCRIGTDDADSRDCGCDGPCTAECRENGYPDALSYRDAAVKHVMDERDTARSVVAEILDLLGQDGHPDSLMLTEWRQRAGLEPRP